MKDFSLERFELFMTDHKQYPSSSAAVECPFRIEVLPGNSASWTTKVRCSAGINHSSANFHGSTGEDLVGRDVFSIAKRGAQEEECQLAKTKFLTLKSLPCAPAADGKAGSDWQRPACSAFTKEFCLRPPLTEWQFVIYFLQLVGWQKNSSRAVNKHTCKFMWFICLRREQTDLNKRSKSMFNRARLISAGSCRILACLCAVTNSHCLQPCPWVTLPSLAPGSKETDPQEMHFSSQNTLQAQM